MKSRIKHKCKSNFFCAIVLSRVSVKAHFELQFRQFERVTISRQLFWRVHDNAANKHGTCKYIFCTPKHIT